jgi:hypothetical protein
MSVHAGTGPPEVLLKRSPVVRDVTTAHISPTVKLSTAELSAKDKMSNKALPPLPSGGSAKSDGSSGYKLLSTIPGAGRKVSQESKSTMSASNVTPTPSTSGYKLLSTIPGAGKNVSSEHKASQSEDLRSDVDKLKDAINKRMSANAKTSSTNVKASTNAKTSTEKLTAPLTIIVPNISRAFARHSRSKSGDESTGTNADQHNVVVFNMK